MAEEGGEAALLAMIGGEAAGLETPQDTPREGWVRREERMGSVIISRGNDFDLTLVLSRGSEATTEEFDKFLQKRVEAVKKEWGENCLSSKFVTRDPDSDYASL